MGVVGWKGTAVLGKGHNWVEGSQLGGRVTVEWKGDGCGGGEGLVGKDQDWRNYFIVAEDPRKA